MSSYFDLYTLIGLFGGAAIGIVALIIYRVVKERREAEYEELDRIEKEKKRIQSIRDNKNSVDAPASKPRTKNLRLLGIEEGDDRRTVGETSTDTTVTTVSGEHTDDWDVSATDDDDFDIKPGNEIVREG